MTPDPCRICGVAAARTVGRVEYFEGLPCDICDCARCGCRWSLHDASVHDRMHQAPVLAYYAGYRDLLDECGRLFKAGDQSAIEVLLRQTAKYQFVLDRLRDVPAGGRVLEWGCSRGYLTSPSILAGRHVLGVDISEDAVAAARQAFGDHFAVAGSPRVDAQAPYDAIYHVGLIGCVADPIGTTRRLLALLKPGGRLFFNAPNRDALFQRGQLWFDSAPPPELVTLFPGGFWTRQFAQAAAVTETVAISAAAESTVKSLVRWLGPKWQRPVPHSLQSATAHRWTQPAPASFWRGVQSAIAKLSSTTNLRIGRWPDEYGLFVEMVRR